DPLKLSKLLVPWVPDSGLLVDAPFTAPDGPQSTFAVDNGPVEERESQAPATFTPTLIAPPTSSSSSSGSAPSSSSGAALPTVAGPPLVAWQPALGATAYEVQVSRQAYPWRTYGNLYTFSTSTTLPLKPGKWYYRVRGINMTLPNGASTMAWSQKVGFVVAKP